MLLQGRGRAAGRRLGRGLGGHHRSLEERRRGGVGEEEGRRRRGGGVEEKRMRSRVEGGAPVDHGQEKLCEPAKSAPARKEGAASLVDASASRRGTPGEEAGFNKIVTIEITGHGKFQFLTESFT